MSAILVAAFHGFANAVKALVEESADLNFASDVPSFTLQGACVRSGTPGVLQVLEDKGIDLSKPFATMIMDNDFCQREQWVTMAHFAVAYSQRGILSALHAKDVDFWRGNQV